MKSYARGRVTLGGEHPVKEQLMLDKKHRINELFDYYGQLLTDKQQQFIQFYYHDDYSLSEIAQNFGISRQAINEHLKRAESLLEEYERILRLVAKHHERIGLHAQITVLTQSLRISDSEDITLLVDMMLSID